MVPLSVPARYAVRAGESKPPFQPGGKVRKLQTMTAKDLPTLLAARAEAIESMYPDDSAMGQEFADICGSHVDYIWNAQLESN